MMQMFAPALLAISLFQTNPGLPVTTISIPDKPPPLPVDDFSALFGATSLNTALVPVHSDDYATQSAATFDAIDAVAAPLTAFSTQVDDVTATQPDTSSGLDTDSGVNAVGGTSMTVRAMVAPMAEGMVTPFAYASGGVTVIKSLSDGFPSFIAVGVVFVGMWVLIGWMVLVRLLFLGFTVLGWILRILQTVKGLIPIIGA